MINEVQHAGPDTTSTRDEFLMKVLAGLLIPDRRAQKIVRTAKHQP